MHAVSAHEEKRNAALMTILILTRLVRRFILYRRRRLR